MEHKNEDPRQGYIRWLADVWREPSPESDGVMRVGDDGTTIAQGLAKARGQVVQIAQNDDDPRAEYIANLNTAWRGIA